MACAIVAGYALDCKDAVGGIKNIYIAPVANVTSLTENASGFVTAITMVGSNKFFKYALEPRGANSTVQNFQTDPTVGTVSYEQNINVAFLKMKYETQYKLQLLIANRMAIIVEMKSGQYFYFGKENGMEVGAGNAASGAAMNEFNGYTVPFIGMEKALAPEVDATIIAALVSPV